MIALGTRSHPSQRPHRRRGFSLAELLLAIFILGIGIISVAAIFPAGITLQRQSNDDSLGPTVAHTALSLLRSRLSQEDFGGFDDHNPLPDPFMVPPSGLGTPIKTLSGDWPWMRPGFYLGAPANTSLYDEGTIDIFSQQYTRKRAGFQVDPAFGAQSLDTNTQLATELFDGWPAASPVLFGIPYNVRKYSIVAASELNDWQRIYPEPRVLITQRERLWPVLSDLPAASSVKPQYAWDCMFRRFQGRVQVAIFVYRVTAPGGAPVSYHVARVDPTTHTPEAPANDPRIPPLPVSFTPPNTGVNRWVAPTTGDPTIVPGTNPATALDFTKASSMWQVPGQWILDQNNNIHRVLVGRRVVSEGPVRFARPIPIMAPSIVFGRKSVSPLPADAAALDSEGVAQAWYMPIRDVNGNQLTPVYLLVEEL